MTSQELQSTSQTKITYTTPVRRLFTLLAVGTVLFLTSPLIIEDFSPSKNARLLSAIVLLMGGGIIVRAIAGLGKHALERSGGAHLIPAIRVAQLIGYVVVVLVALTTAGYKLSGLLAGGTVLTAIIGLALQASLSNVFAGLLLNSSRAFRIGDTISVRSWAFGGVEFTGVVKDITLIHTILEGLGGVMRVPNARMVDSTISILTGVGAAITVVLPHGLTPDHLEREIDGVRVQAKHWSKDGLEVVVHLPNRADALTQLLAYLQTDNLLNKSDLSN